jgi:methylmalonyl-CoA/ethylmalonyl-CoA epimerase
MASTPVNLPFGGDFALAQIGQISLRAVNVPRAVRFYHDVLRLPLAFQTETMAFFMAGAVRLMLAVPESPEFDHPSSVLYFAVPDIRAAYQALAERGVRFPQPPQRVAVLSTGELWMAFFRDSENNVLALMSEQRGA